MQCSPNISQPLVLIIQRTRKQQIANDSVPSLQAGQQEELTASQRVGGSTLGLPLHETNNTCALPLPASTKARGEWS